MFNYISVAFCLAGMTSGEMVSSSNDFLRCVSKWLKLSIGSGNGLLPIKRKAITWTTSFWLHMISLTHNKYILLLSFVGFRVSVNKGIAQIQADDKQLSWPRFSMTIDVTKDWWFGLYIIFVKYSHAKLRLAHAMLMLQNCFICIWRWDICNKKLYTWGLSYYLFN